MSKVYSTPARLASAKDRGSADAYYGKPERPCIWLDNMGIDVDYDLSVHEARAYKIAYRQAELHGDRKDWNDEGPLK